MLAFDDVVDGPLFHEPFRWRMGLRSLATGDWLQVDDAVEADLEEKDHILRAHRDDAIAALPDADTACVALADLVADELRARGRTPSTDGSTALERIARSVQEDFCVLEPRPEGWVVTAGAVCFPTRWSIAEKLGGTLLGIHEPVPGYESTLGPRVERFFDRLQPGGLAWRLNWSIVDRADRRLPVDTAQAPMVLPADPGRDVFLRLERQTLRRLPDVPAVIFGIRIHVWSLEDVLPRISVPELTAALASMPPSIAAYKDLAGVRGPLIEWLQRTW